MRLPAFVYLSVCLSVCLLARLLKTRGWIWMKCCVSTDVGTWRSWLTFEPDPNHSPDAGTGKSICQSPSNKHLTQSRLQVMWCTAERYCLLLVVVQGPGSFRGRSTFPYDVRLRSYSSSKLKNFLILAYFPHTKPAYSLCVTSQNDYDISMW